MSRAFSFSSVDAIRIGDCRLDYFAVWIIYQP
jgi:hypothetical protein